MKHALAACLMMAMPMVGINAQEHHSAMSMDLGGQWEFAMDTLSSIHATDPFDDTILLPGTTDTNAKGPQCSYREETTHLTRLHPYAGRAWYRRAVDIPSQWQGKTVVLTLERTKTATVYVDGVPKSHACNISTPQRHNLGCTLAPGKHTIAIMVDNSPTGNDIPPQVFTNSHAATEDTQTNWNGIIGRLQLDALPQAALCPQQISIRPDVGKRELHVSMDALATLPTARKDTMRLSIAYKVEGAQPPTEVATMELNMRKWQKEGTPTLTTDMPADAPTWSEFCPATYTLKVELTGHAPVEVGFPWTDFEARDGYFHCGGHTIFLRGKHDACVFPLTAHAPMDTASWRSYLATCKEYGINHIRFHSWCPPEACFQMADEMGVFLQPELPFWGDFNSKDTLLMGYLRQEARQILQAYAHHPSFVMFSLGNELWGDIHAMQALVAECREQEPRLLYTLGSNMYLGYKGVLPQMDFFTTCRNGGEAWGTFDTHTRGSFSFADAVDGGLINHSHPNTSMTMDSGVGNCATPIISHETGQFQSYPDYDEIRKYTGPLYPYNMEVFRQRLQKTGMGDQAKAFHDASGRWAVQLYKADMELDLRTRGIAGYQLLDLQDYPGQGSAYVGVLDAFMQSKGITTPQEWRQWCSPVVPLMAADKMCYSNNEKLTAGLSIANYGNDNLNGKLLRWTLIGHGKAPVANGEIILDNIDEGLNSVGQISVDLSPIKRAEKLTLALQIRGTDYRNSYPVWVYPDDEDLQQLKKGIVVADTLSPSVMKALAKGEKVLLMPSRHMADSLTVGPLFQTDYWNYRMFKTICENNKKPVSPGTLGLLTDPEHPLLGGFPSESHTSWQWFAVVKASRPMILDATPANYRPTVQVIDNVERNHKLGLVFEFAVGKGRLLVCMADLQEAAQWVEGRAFYRSLLHYMQSDKFAPTSHITPEQLKRLFTTSVAETQIGELRNISFD